MTQVNYEEILDFWFNGLSDEDKWMGGQEIDDLIKDKFGAVIEAGKRGELVSWRETVQGRVAEIIVLDQFSRNIYRGQPESFSSDDMALVLAQELLANPDYDQLNDQEKYFGAMPFMHAESLYIQEHFSLKFFSQPGFEDGLEHAQGHYEVIKKFGRFPHRNEALGRESTEAELAHIKETDVY